MIYDESGKGTSIPSSKWIPKAIITLQLTPKMSLLLGLKHFSGLTIVSVFDSMSFLDDQAPVNSVFGCKATLFGSNNT